MDDFYWSTYTPHSDNSETMQEYLDEFNDSLTIDHVDGTRAEGVCKDGNRYAIHASGNGDSFNHKVEFELIGRSNQDN